MTVTVEIARRGTAPAPRRWVCPKCASDHDPADVKQNLSVCPACGYHQRIGARERIVQLADEGTFVEYWSHLRTLDPLTFTDLDTNTIIRKQGRELMEQGFTLEITRKPGAALLAYKVEK